MYMGPRNWFLGMNSASLCSLAGRYENPIPPQCLAPKDFLKIPALLAYCSTFASMYIGSILHMAVQCTMYNVRTVVHVCLYTVYIAKKNIYYLAQRYCPTIWPEPVFVNLLRSPAIDFHPGGIDSLVSIPGLTKRLQIGLMSTAVLIGWDPATPPPFWAHVRGRYW
jgi:hypothetical protein